MKKPLIGVQMYAVRDEFQKMPSENLYRTLKSIKEMGYDAVEMNYWTLNEDHDVESPEVLKEWLTEIGLICNSMLISWKTLEPENLEECFRDNEKIGNKRIVIGGASKEELRSYQGMKRVIKTLNDANEAAKKAGFYMGYHAHAGDFYMVDGVSSWDRIMQETPQDFGMIVDTGNMMDGLADPIHYFNKYPGRSPVVHLKPYDKKFYGAATMIGEDSFDWNELVRTSVEVGKADTLMIEYTNYTRYQPMEAIKLCYEKLLPIIENL